MVSHMRNVQYVLKVYIDRSWASNTVDHQIASNQSPNIIECKRFGLVLEYPVIYSPAMYKPLEIALRDPIYIYGYFDVRPNFWGGDLGCSIASVKSSEGWRVGELTATYFSREYIARARSALLLRTSSVA